MSLRASFSLPRVKPIVPTLRPQPFNDPAWLFDLLQCRSLRSPIIAAAAILAVTGATPLTVYGQCSEPHYRWSEKTDGSLANLAAVTASVSTILKSWALPEFTSQAKYKCAARQARELKVYSVTGWVRRVKTGESDGDWHIELTSGQSSPVGSCIVLEIPPADLNGNYAQARLDLQSRVTWDSHGDVVPPVRLQVIGAAFFDGQHRGTDLAKADGSHGRCNSSARALWEIHPVYWVKQP